MGVDENVLKVCECSEDFRKAFDRYMARCNEHTIDKETQNPLETEI